jgi:hypothetical protein
MKRDNSWIMLAIPAVAIVAMTAFGILVIRQERSMHPVTVEVTAIAYEPDERERGWMHKDGCFGSTVLQTKDGFRFRMRGNYGTNGIFKVQVGKYDDGFWHFRQMREEGK